MVGDKLFKTGGWSSKKFSGVLLIINSIIMGYLALLIPYITISAAILLISPFLATASVCLGIDAYNKKQRNDKD